MSDHALLSPSAAHRWLECGASIEACRGIETALNEAAKLGHSLHEDGEKAIGHYLKTGERTEVPEKVSTYVDFVIEQYELHNLLGNCSVHLEERLEQQDYEGKFKVFGTSDCILETDNELVVIDYKSGFGEVKIEENVQLAIYGILAQQKFNKPVKRLIIVQNDVIKEWSNEYDINTFIEILRAAIKKIQNDLEHGNAKFTAGSHCRYCPFKFSCRTYAESVSPMVAQLPDPARANEEELSKLYSIANFLNIYVKAVESEVKKRAIEQRKRIPGFKVVQGRGRRTWENSDEEIIATLRKKGYKVSQITDKKLKSFTQIEKIDAKAKELVKTLVTKAAGNYKVVANSEPGEPALSYGDVLPTIEIDK